MHHPPLCRQISINPCLHNELACKHLLLLLLEIQSEKKNCTSTFYVQAYHNRKIVIPQAKISSFLCRVNSVRQLQYAQVYYACEHNFFFISDPTYCNLRAFFLLQHPMFMLLDKSISIVGCYFEISKCSIVILFKKEKNGFCQRHDSPEFSLYEFSHHVVQLQSKRFFHLVGSQDLLYQQALNSSGGCCLLTWYTHNIPYLRSRAG